MYSTACHEQALWDYFEEETLWKNGISQRKRSLMAHSYRVLSTKSFTHRHKNSEICESFLP